MFGTFNPDPKSIFETEPGQRQCRAASPRATPLIMASVTAWGADCRVVDWQHDDLVLPHARTTGLLDADGAPGDFVYAEEAARQLLDERIAKREAEDGDDLTWAKPDVDEALASADRGEGLTVTEHRDRKGARLAALKD